MRFWDWHGDGSLAVGVLALACCNVEVEAALLGRDQLPQVPAAAAVVLIVAGTVTDAVAPRVAASLRAYGDATIVSFGACASAGGPYWDSPVVTKGIDQLVPVDHYVPGCPPTPAALAALLNSLDAATVAGHA